MASTTRSMPISALDATPGPTCSSPAVRIVTSAASPAAVSDADIPSVGDAARVCRPSGKWSDRGRHRKRARRIGSHPRRGPSACGWFRFRPTGWRRSGVATSLGSRRGRQVERSCRHSRSISGWTTSRRSARPRTRGSGFLGAPRGRLHDDGRSVGRSRQPTRRSRVGPRRAPRLDDRCVR